MPIATESAWTLVKRLLKKVPQLSEGASVWLAQPEASESFFEIAALLPQKKKITYQSFRPEVNEISRHGLATVQTLSDTQFDLAICVATRQRNETMGLIAHALRHSPYVLFACPNNLGAGGFITRLEEAFPTLEADSGEKCLLGFARLLNGKSRSRGYVAQRISAHQSSWV